MSTPEVRGPTHPTGLSLRPLTSSAQTCTPTMRMTRATPSPTLPLSLTTSMARLSPSPVTNLSGSPRPAGPVTDPRGVKLWLRLTTRRHIGRISAASFLGGRMFGGTIFATRTRPTRRSLPSPKISRPRRCSTSPVPLVAELQHRSTMQNRPRAWLASRRL